MTAPSWEFDKLGRQEDSQFLSNYILARYSQDENARSFVLNLNAEWGLGKTYFLQNWGQDLKAAGHPVVFFNAWENVFAEPPLLALASAIGESLSDSLGNDAGLQRLLKGIVSNAAKLADSAVKSRSVIKRSRQAFKNNLLMLLENIGKRKKTSKLPLFVFIDELDRCRPEYAVEMLESINHMFEAGGIYFVIATDSRQLACLIQAIYGAHFDADRFLKRFFDQEYTLSEPENYRFSEYLFQRYKLDAEKRLFSPLSRKYLVTDSIHADLFALSAKYFRLSLRDQEQVCAMLKATSLTWAGERRIHLLYLLFLLMLRQRSSVLFEKYIHLRTVSSKTAFLKSDEYRVLVDDSIIVRTSKPTRDGFHTPEEKDRFENLLAFYMDYAERTLPQILESNGLNLEVYIAVRQELLANMPEQYNPENPPRHELSRYPDVVRKVSNLARQ